MTIDFLIMCAHEGSCRHSVAEIQEKIHKHFRSSWAVRASRFNLTFKMEEHIRTIILEHLCGKLNIHVLNIDFLFLC